MKTLAVPCTGDGFIVTTPPVFVSPTDVRWDDERGALEVICPECGNKHRYTAEFLGRDVTRAIKDELGIPPPAPRPPLQPPRGMFR